MTEAAPGWTVTAVLNAASAPRYLPRIRAATADDEIVVIESNGRLRIDDPHQEAGVKKVDWNSGDEIGWTGVAAGDFNGDSDAEIVAIKGATIKVFDPVLQPGSAAVTFVRTLDSGSACRLVATGDFDNDGRDEIVVTHTGGTGYTETLKVYDGGSNGTVWELIHNEGFGALWQDMATGDLTGDGADELVVVRQTGNLLKVFRYNASATSQKMVGLAEGSYTFPWLAVGVGNISSSYAGDELALSRTGVEAVLESLILFRLVGSSIVDLPIQNAVNLKFFPHFTSLALGDLNGDLDDEILLLRDPTVNLTSLLMVNPNGAAMRNFEQVIGYGSTAWKLVRAGDTDADGRDEVVILRGDRYWIYQDPDVNDSYTETAGSYYTTSTTNNLPLMAVANVDGPGQPVQPVGTRTPTVTCTPSDATTYTSTPTSTPAPTQTPTPNWTATHTSTSTPVPTPTRTPTRPPFHCTRVTEIPLRECKALVALYNSTNGSGWDNKTHWLVTTAPCNWFGVSCGAGHVIELALGENQMNGTIPPELANLAHLRWLNLTSNQLRGSIPPELGNLVDLEALSFLDNQLSGSIPPEFGHLVSLWAIDLGYNQLSGSIPPELGDLANLERLFLAGNQLNGNIPSELSQLESLRVLYLVGNRLSGPIPPQLANLINLEEFWLSGNQLSGTMPPELGKLSKLKTLYLSGNRLSGPLPQSLTNLNLVAFWFNDTALCEPPDAPFQAWLASIGNLRRTDVLCAMLYLPITSRTQ